MISKRLKCGALVEVEPTGFMEEKPHGWFVMVTDNHRATFAVTDNGEKEGTPKKVYDSHLFGEKGDGPQSRVVFYVSRRALIGIRELLDEVAEEAENS